MLIMEEQGGLCQWPGGKSLEKNHGGKGVRTAEHRPYKQEGRPVGS